MKKLIILISLFVISSAVFCQEGDTLIKPKNKLGFSLLPFTIATMEMHYEHFYNSGNSIWIAPSVRYSNSDYSYDDKFGVGIAMQYRIYVFEKFKREHYKRIFFAPYAFYQYSEVKNEYYYYYYEYDGMDYPGYEYGHNEQTIHSVGGGFLFGLQYQFAKRVFVDAYVGGGIRKSNPEDGWDDLLEPGYSGFAPKVGLDIGFSL